MRITWFATADRNAARDHHCTSSLRPVCFDDVTALHALFVDEPALRFLWDGQVIPVEHTREIVDALDTNFYLVLRQDWDCAVRLGGLGAPSWSRALGTPGGRNTA